MVMKAKKRRPSKHERLLKALLKSNRIMRAINLPEALTCLSDSNFKQIQAIKEAMEKGAKV